MLDRFRSLFRGGELGYGEWSQQRGPGKEALTVRGLVPLAAYEKHLSGEVGLGLVPVTQAGTCHFAAIDIDIDTINHQQLYDEIARRHLPLHVCRSKSGGAHLYLFPREPLPASQVQALLRRWAALLGYPSAEIFPKQTHLGGTEVGNWINLPYFGGRHTTRYSVGKSGQLELEDFLNSITFYEPDVTGIDEAPAGGTKQLPPCLQALSAQKLPEGAGRNNVLFNVAVFYRKSEPSTWESRVVDHNSNKFSPPLDFREVQSVVKSASRVRYQYTCEQSPLREVCNEPLCRTLPYGVGNMPWKEQGAFDDAHITDLCKLMTDPPRYLVKVNGKELEISSDDFMVYTRFRTKVYQYLDLMITPMKQPQWEQQIRELTIHKKNIEAPEDASLAGLVIQRFEEFLSLRERATNKEDLLRGLPVVQGDQIIFRVADFRRHLQIYKLDRMDGSELYFLLRKKGATHTRVRLAGKTVAVWSCPLTATNDQTEDFAIPEFEMPEEPF
jgi:hypothetical protein